MSFDHQYYYIVSGVFVTLKYAISACLIGSLLGLLIAFLRMNHNSFLKNIARLYISVIRGTPLMVQLSIVYFGLSGILKAEISPFLAGLIAFSINSSAYVAEIIRAGINSVDHGQFEAAKALAIPYRYMMKDIILPQAIKNIAPSLVNEMINLTKESAIISIIGELDIMRRAQLIAASSYDFFTPLLIAGICYYTLVLVLTIIAEYIEKSSNA
jgi:polar amino acid transport system permease protein